MSNRQIAIIVGIFTIIGTIAAVLTIPWGGDNSQPQISAGPIDAGNCGQVGNDNSCTIQQRADGPRYDYQQKALASCARIQESLEASIIPDFSPLDPGSPNFNSDGQATFSRSAYEQYVDQSGSTAANQITELLRELAPNDLDGQRNEVSQALMGLTSAIQTLRGDLSRHLPESIPASQFFNYQNSAPVQAWRAAIGTLGDALTRLAGEECKIEPSP